MTEKETKPIVIRLTEEEHAVIQARRQQEMGEFDLAAIRPGLPIEDMQKALRVIGRELRKTKTEVDLLRTYVKEKSQTAEGKREVLQEIGRALA